MTEQKIRSHAERFRRCLEELDSELGHPFLSFPEASCGDASRLLGQWLTDHGVFQLTLVVAERHGKSHAWLEVDDLIIDITADQFDDGPGAVYVSKDRSFHGQFEEDVREPHGLDKELEDGYELCKEWMQANSAS